MKIYLIGDVVGMKEGAPLVEKEVNLSSPVQA